MKVKILPDCKLLVDSNLPLTNRHALVPRPCLYRRQLNITPTTLLVVRPRIILRVTTRPSAPVQAPVKLRHRLVDDFKSRRVLRLARAGDVSRGPVAVSVGCFGGGTLEAVAEVWAEGGEAGDDEGHVFVEDGPDF